MRRYRFILPLASFLVLSAVFINPACGQTGNSRAASGRTAQQGGGGQGQCQKGHERHDGHNRRGGWNAKSSLGKAAGGMQNPFNQGSSTQGQNRYQQAMMMQQMMYYQMMMQQYYLQSMMQNPNGQNTQFGGNPAGKEIRRRTKA